MLLHFGPVTFGFMIGKPKPHRFHGFRTWLTCPWLPKPILSIFGDTKYLQRIQENTDSFLEIIIWQISDGGKSKLLKSLEKKRAEQS